MNMQSQRSSESGRSGKASILIVEDEGVVARDIGNSLRESGYDVVGIAATAEDALRVARERSPQVVLMDIRLRGKVDGIQAAHSIWQTHAIPIIFLTANSDEETQARALQAEPHGYLVKPFRTPELRCAIEISLHRHAMAARLREREQWLTTTLRSIGDAVVATDATQRVSFMNPVAEHLTGWRADEAVGSLLSDVVQLYAAPYGKPVDTLFERALAEKTATRLKDDVMLVAKNGSMVFVNNNAAPILNDVGTVLGGVMVFRDVSEQRRAEQEVQLLNAQLEQRVLARTAELEAANRELEAFSYSVAHDLRTPLRAIDGFAQLLIEDQAPAVDTQAADHLRRIRGAAQRMGQLIDALLRLAHVARHSLNKQHVDLSQLANEIAEQLRSAHPLRSVQWLIAGGLSVQGDRELMKIVLENLLGNAWKFTAHVTAARIEIGSELRDSRPAWFVRDNGVGFDMQAAHKMFGAFERLHAPDEFDGTGIGLAIVERIIQRHGGRVWAEGDVGRGAMLLFSL